MNTLGFVSGCTELATFLGVSVRTIQRLNRSGLLNSAMYRIGKRRIVYDVNKVLEILKEK